MKKNTKIWIGILIALILLIIGFYLYYFYPQAIPGLASISPSLKEDVNLLVIGLDDLESVQKDEIEADSLVLFKLQTKEKKLDLINIVIKDKVVSDEASIKNLLSKVEGITGVSPAYYFTISYNGFENLIDNIGGVEINLDEDLKVAALDLDLKAGNNFLSGQEVLNYSRWYDYKKDETDRIKRQQQVINSIIKEVVKSDTLLNVPQLFSTTVDTFKMVNTNIDQNLIAEILQFMKNRDDLEINYGMIQE